MTLRFCPGASCPHYGQATKYPRKCYYEPQCLRGKADKFLEVILTLVSKRHREVSND